MTSSIETALLAAIPPEAPLATVLEGLDLLADVVLTDLAVTMRRKCEHLITELVYRRDATRTPVLPHVRDDQSFAWLSQMRFCLDLAASVPSPIDRLTIKMADAIFPYGWEYLGVPDKLVQTPLTDRVCLTLTKALDNQLGGAPFGPAGTGKTVTERCRELISTFSWTVSCSQAKPNSVKALGVQLGRFVLVFCCDEMLDFQAMGRIFIGVCQVGASMNSINWKHAFSVLYHSKCRRSNKDLFHLPRTPIRRLNSSERVSS